MKPLLPIVALTSLLVLQGPTLAQTSTPADPAHATPAAPAAKATTPAPAAAPAATTPAATSATPTLQAEGVVVCKDVQDRAPVSAGDSFPSNAGTLMCFSKITGAETAQIYHRWYVGDKMVAEIPIPVKASSWRCWSRKTVLPGWQGECHVDVATESGDVIATAKFNLTSAAAAPAATTPQG